MLMALLFHLGVRLISFLPQKKKVPEPEAPKAKASYTLDLTPEVDKRFIFPGPTDRVTVNGMTGSGKSTFAIWLFSESADFDKRPWIFLDFKGEDIINQALSEDIFKPLKIDADLKKLNPGIYVVHHDASQGQGPVAAFLWRIYAKGKTGMFLDEATMVPELRGESNSGGPFQSILSQGRSKGIPTYVLAQRPVNVNNMVFTENNYYSAFELSKPEDVKKVAGHIPWHSQNYSEVWDPDLMLKDFHSRWYDRKRKISFLLDPCPSEDEILNKLFSRVDRMRKKEKV